MKKQKAAAAPAGKRLARFAGLVLLALVSVEVTLRLLGGVYALSRRLATRQDGFTVLCVGDSFTYGAGAPAEGSYPVQLERLLNAEYEGGFRVVNAGRPASNSSQMLKALPAQVRKSAPDVVVVMTGFNDSNTEDSNYDLFLKADWKGQLRSAARRLLSRSRAWRFFRTAARHGPDLFRRLLPPAPPAPLTEEQERFAGRFDRAMETAGPAGALREAEAFLSANGGDAVALERKAIALELAHRHGEALESVATLVRLHPEHVRGRLRLAQYLWKSRRFEEALRQWEEVVRLDPGNAEARSRLYYKWQTLTPNEEKFPVFEKLMRYNLRQVRAELPRRVKLAVMSYPQGDRDRNIVREEFCAAAGAVYVDNLPVFNRLLEKASPWEYFSGDEPEILVSHCNAKGYGVIARNLAEAMEKAGWIRRRAAGNS